MPIPFQWMYEAIDRGQDPLSGARVMQLTSQHIPTHNVYCEERYTSVDGTRIAFMRFPRGYACGGHELWVAELPGPGAAGPRVAFVGHVAYPLCTSNPDSDWLYYAAPPSGCEESYCSRGIYDLRDASSFTADGGPQRLMRVNLKTLELEELFVFENCPPPMSQAISPDGAQFVSITSLGDEVYGLYRVNIGQGDWEVFHEQAEIRNPHLQFEPGEGRMLMVQHNRSEGTTLYTVDMQTGSRTCLPVGVPVTEGHVTGHECWIGRTGRVLLSVCTSENWWLLTTEPGDDQASVLTTGMSFNHVSASVDGRLFAVDQWWDPGFGRVWIGSFQTGRYLPLVESGTSRGPYCAEPFPYITPDLRHVIYNSNATGITQVYMAELPEHMLAALSLEVPRSC